MTPFSNKGLNLHRDSISFHLSHQPPLSVMCNFYVVKMSLLAGKMPLSLHKKWHITDRGGWWLKWKLILSRWRIGPLFENWVTFVIDFQKVVCVVLYQCWTLYAWMHILGWKAALKICQRYWRKWAKENRILKVVPKLEKPRSFEYLTSTSGVQKFYPSGS